MLFLCPLNLLSLTINPAGEFGSLGFKAGYLNRPMGMVPVKNSLFIVDNQNQRISVFNQKSKFQYLFDQTLDEDGDESEILNPTHIAFDKRGLLYVVDSEDSAILQFDTFGRFLNRYGAFGSVGVKFNEPKGIAVDSFGDVYVADYGNNRILKMNTTGGFLFKILSNEGHLTGPKDVEVVYNGDIYVLDESGLKVFDGTGHFLELLIPIKNSYAFCLDDNNNIYITLPAEELIKVFNSKGELLTIIELDFLPLDISYQSPTLFISDPSNHKIIKYEIL
jgi:tripartite motif-containing protein 71